VGTGPPRREQDPQGRNGTPGVGCDPWDWGHRVGMGPLGWDVASGIANGTPRVGWDLQDGDIEWGRDPRTGMGPPGWDVAPGIGDRTAGVGCGPWNWGQDPQGWGHGVVMGPPGVGWDP